MARGGHRPGSGRKAGGQNKQTIEKEVLREEYRLEVRKHIPDLVRAQLATAKGVHHMRAKDPKTGQWVEVTDAALIDRCLAAGESFYDIYAQNPNVQALKDIFDRLMDQPARALEVSGKDGTPLVVKWEQ